MDDGEKTASTGTRRYHQISAFTQELLDEVARHHYSLRGWHTFLSRSWKRSLDDLRASPTRTRSFCRWAIFVWVIGTGVILLALGFLSAETALMSSLLWFPWYISAVFFVLAHLGMVENSRGLPTQSLLMPNGLSFLRLSLAPLVVWPCLTMPAHPVTGPIFALLLAGLSLSDVFDGWLARCRGLCTRMGRMLDFLADVALLSFLALGLYLADAVPGSLFWLLLARYPLLLAGILVFYLAKGPAPLQPTLIGRATTLATSVVLLVVAFNRLLPITWPKNEWIQWSLYLLHVLIVANLFYLVYRAILWAGAAKGGAGDP